LRHYLSLPLPLPPNKFIGDLKEVRGIRILGQVFILKGGRPPHLDHLAYHRSGFEAGWCIWAYAAPAFFDLIDPNGLEILSLIGAWERWLLKALAEEPWWNQGCRL